MSLAGASQPYGTLYGFTALASDRERAAESQFLDIPSAAGALAVGAATATQPHAAGSAADHQIALYLRDQLASFGFAATVEPFTARVDTLKSVALTLYPSGNAPEVVSSFGAAHGIFSRPRRPRGSKSTAAPAATPAAVVTPVPLPPVPIDLREPPLESDPDSANPAIGIPFLAGSADGELAAPLMYAGRGGDGDYALLVNHGVDVRGAIALIRAGREFRGITARRAQAHGVAAVLFYDDPAEDGPSRGAAYPVGAYRPSTAVRRGTVGEGVTIPVLPISAANAQLVLATLHGPTAAAPWRGALPVGYAIARGPATARLSLHLTRKQTMLWNTVGVMQGTHPEQSVVLGAHRDAWVFGAGDNAAGVETIVEAARGLGYIAKSGWHPLRTIVVAAWDGEGLGAYGTTAYINIHGDDLRQGGIAYLDAEQTVTGPRFGVDVVAAIAGVAGDATHAVDDPLQPGGSLFDRWGRFSYVLPPRFVAGASDRGSSPLFGIGIPSANAGFSGPFGVDGSAYDTNAFANTISDPGFALHRAAGQLYGVMAMRLADAGVVPYRFAAYVPLMQGAVRGLAIAARGAKVKLDANGLGASIGRFANAARRFDDATASATNGAAGDRALEAARVLDVAVYGTDGYATVTLPEIAHAVAQPNQGDVDRAVSRTRAALDRATGLLAR